MRFTGGEPLLVQTLEDVVAATAALAPAARDRAHHQRCRAGAACAALAAAGLDRVNVSLDSVDATHFAAITRRDRLADVLDGLAAAEQAGLGPVKVNAVLDPVTGRDDVVAAAAVLPRRRLPPTRHRTDATRCRAPVAPRATR